MRDRNGKPPRSFMSELRSGRQMVHRDGSKPPARATLIDGAPVADLTAERLRCAQKGDGEEVYTITRYVFDGLVGHDLDPDGDRGLEVLLVTDGALSALGMSARDAIRLGERLIEEGKAAPSMNPKPVGPESA